MDKLIFKILTDFIGVLQLKTIFNIYICFIFYLIENNTSTLITGFKQHILKVLISKLLLTV